jgi:RNA polymerase sigma-70 factor (ECF subfamily)
MAEFATTRWTLVQQAGDAAHPGAMEALDYLCRVYWPPVYVYFRGRGLDASAAADLTQEFFARILEKNYFELARRERGSFRSFLLTCAKNFLANDWDRQHAQKRGGGTTVIPLECGPVEERFQREPGHDLTPERIFEQQWAWSLVQQALTRLERDVRQAGRDQLYAECRDLLQGSPGEGTYREIAARLNMTEGALKVQIHRLRRRLREILIDEILQAGTPAGDADAELRHLITVLSRPRE